MNGPGLRDVARALSGSFFVAGLVALLAVGIAAGVLLGLAELAIDKVRGRR